MGLIRDQDDRNSVTDELGNEVGRSFGDRPEDSDTPRDTVPMRWVKFLSIIVTLAVLLGVFFVFADYVNQFCGKTYAQRQIAEQRVNHDHWPAMRQRFIIGASVGAGLGTIYMVWCLIKKKDP
jgi:hypothetical protein